MHKTIKNLNEFNAYFRQPTCHPLVGVGDLSEAAYSLFEPIDFDSYCVVLMEADFGELTIDGETVKYLPGTVFTMKPGEIVSMKLHPYVRPRGKMLLFRRELIENTGLGRDFYMFNFFDFDVSEALLLNDSEKKVMLNCFANIDAELHTENDELTGHMLRLGIGQTLSYCKRFYERQFDTKQLRSSEFIKNLDSLLNDYYSPHSELPRTIGYPTVAWCSAQLHLAPNYFGNLVRRDMHISAQEYIHNTIVERAKSLLAEPSLSVEEIADQLGFPYPNHFSRLFKRKTGLSPTAFRRG